MRYDLSTLLKNHRNEVMKENVVENGANVEKPVTLGSVLERAAVFGGNPNAGSDEKYKQFLLAKYIADADGVIELTAEQVAKLKDMAGPMFGPIGFGALVTALENPSTLEDIKAGGTA